MNEEFSCIKQVVKTVQVPLPLSFITNEVAGISEILDSWKRQYVKSLHGVVVDYKNVSLTSRTGYILVNKPFICYFVKATFDLFCPNVGDIVKGKINRISREHIGCLIQGTINVTIHLSQNSSTELSQFVSLNHDILFEIAHFEYERKMIRVKGEITPKCLQLMKDLFPPVNDTSVTSTHVIYNFDEGIGTSRENSQDSSSELFSESSTMLNNIEESDVKSEVLSNNSENPLSLPKKEKKKSSKRKSEHSIFSDFSTVDETPKKKHKKKMNSLTENSSSIYSDVLDTVKKEVFSPMEDTDEESLGKKGKKRKRESSDGSESKKKRKKKVKEVNGLVIDSPNNINLTDEKNLEKKKRNKKSDAGNKKNVSKKSKLKKKNKLLTSGDVLKKDKSNKNSKKKKKLKDKKSKKHKESKSHKKVKSKKKKEKTCSSKSKNISNTIKAETS